jgi:beta-galactosidase/beta-glucuronidase
MVSLIDANGIAVDSRNMSVGFRATLWDADQGFFINGQPLRQRGFSHHNSFAGVGVAIPPRLDLFRAQVSRALGANIWRMSHNPYRTSLYDILDALGTLVWDENRDMGPSYKHQMHDMVKRGRNHASIVVNSLCNEIECGSIMNASGVNVVGAAMVNFSKTLDPTRPTTANSDSKDGLGSVIDVQGFSHGDQYDFAWFKKHWPTKPYGATECCSCETQRLEDSDLPKAAGVYWSSWSQSCTSQQSQASNGPMDVSSTFVWTLHDYYVSPSSFGAGRPHHK